MRKVTMIEIRSKGLIVLSHNLGVLEAVFKGCHDHASIHKKIENNYLDPCFKDHEIESGGSAVEKHIDWAIWDLNKKGFLKRTARGQYWLTEKGMAMLKALPYYLDSFLEKELDQKGILSGKAFHDLHKHDDGSYGAAVEATYIRSLLKQIAEP